MRTYIKKCFLTSDKKCLLLPLLWNLNKNKFLWKSYKVGKIFKFANGLFRFSAYHTSTNISKLSTRKMRNFNMHLNFIDRDWQPLTLSRKVLKFASWRIFTLAELHSYFYKFQHFFIKFCL